MTLTLVVLGLPLTGAGVSAALALTPVSPPAAVNPPPAMQTVTTPGPTSVTGKLTADTVWGPQGSPYMVTGQLTIPAGMELTLLPGTVVKMGTQADIVAFGELLSLGDPTSHVVITSARDDSVLGDSNGDGNATSPAPGDWYMVDTQNTGAAVFDYSDVRYGGWGSACWAYGELTASQGEMIVANSSITNSQNAAIFVAPGTSPAPSAGIYNSSISSSCMGVAASQPGELDVIGNTFNMPSGNTALFLLYPQKTRVWFNTINGLSAAAGPTPTTRAMADVRFNQLGGVYDFGAPSYQLNDWSDNWWGTDANSPLPACMDQNAAANAVPQVTVSSTSTGCPSGQYQVTGYTRSVLPALSASPQVLPASVREAAAPRFGPVNTYSGALTYSVDDMSIQDAGKSITQSRTYRSDRLSGGDVGTGWRSAYDEVTSLAAGTTNLSLPDGTSVPFATDAAAGYTPAPGVSASFTSGASGSTITSPDQLSYQFDATGALTGIDLGDPGHHLTVSDSGGHVSMVTGVSDRYLSYAYATGELSSVTDSSGREVSYATTGSQLTSATGVDGQAETYAYDSAGRLTTVTEPDGLVKLAAGYGTDGRVAWIQQAGGGRTTFAYDDANQKRTITLADGTVITQTYDFAGRLVSERLGSTGSHVVYDGEGRVVATISGVPSTPMTGYSPSANITMYNGQGDPYVTVDPMGSATNATFNSMHEPLVTTRPDGTTVSRVYDSNGRLTSVEDPRGNTWKYTYNSFGQVTGQTDPLGRTRSIGYAANGDATSLTDQAGAVTKFGFDSVGRRTSVTDALNNETDIAYTSWGATAKITSPAGGITSISFDSDRRQTAVVNPLTKSTGYQYDIQGRLATTTDALGGKWTISYDALGRPVQAADPRGSTYKRTYTAEGWVATTTDPDGNVTHYAYDPNGRMTRVTDPTGAVTQTVYDRSGHIIEVDKPDGSVQKWSYDSMGRLVQYTLPLGGVQQTSYDSSGNVVSVMGPRRLNIVTLYGTTSTYDAVGRITSTTDAMGTKTSYAYDDAKRTVTVTDPLGTVSVTSYDADGRVIARADGAGGTTSYAYDADSNVKSVTDPIGNATSYGYDLSHQLTSVTDPLLRTTSYGYDAVGHVTQVTYPAGDSESYSYDGVGNITGRTDRNGKSWSYDYDAARHLLTAADPLGDVTAYTYDANGRQVSVTDPTGAVTNTAYDPVGRPAVISDGSGASWVTTYDADGNITKTVDPSATTWTYSYDQADEMTSSFWQNVSHGYNYTYDANGRLTEKDDPYTTKYGYDVRGDITTVIDALANPTTYGYDGAGRVTSTTLPSGNETTASYDKAGRITGATDGAGDTTGYSYDAAGQLAQVTLPRGGTYAYAYDGDGRLSSQTDPLTDKTAYTFDAMGNLTKVIYPSGSTVTSTYDAAGNRTGSVAGAVTRSFSYDNASRLTSATVSGQTGSNPSLAWTYNSLGLMSSSTDGLGTTSYGYDAAHQLTTTTPPSGTATTIDYSNGLPSSISGPVSVGMYYNTAGQLTNEFGGLDSPGFTYDANGRMTGADLASATYNVDGKVATLTQSEPGNSANNTTTFGYDKAGRIQSATLARGGNTVSTTTYGWDADSNRTSMAVTGQPTIATSYNKADQATSDSAGTTYGYSLDGQLTSATDSAGTATHYSYDPYGKLAGSTGPNGTVSYARDALARIAVRTAGSASQSYSYAGTSGLLAGQQSGGTTTDLVRDGSGTLYAMASAGGTALRVNPDIHGDIGQLVDPASHTTAWSAVYDPFGGAFSTGTSPVNLGFQSMLTDPVTGLTDMGARSYNAASGTFTSVDSLIGVLAVPPALNRYLYGSGDPVGNFDPTGYCGFSLSLSNLESCATDLWSGATQLWDSGWSTANQLWDSAWSAASQAVSSAASWLARHVVPYAVTVAQDLASAYHSISAVIQSHLPMIRATVASVVVGGVAFVACEGITGGVGSIACAAAGGAAGGAVYSAMMCPQGTAVLHCAATGFLAGGLAGLALGPVAELGLGLVPADAIGSGGDAALGTSALDRLGAEVASGDSASATADATIPGPGAPPAVSDTPAPATLADTAPGTITPGAAIEPATPAPEAATAADGAGGGATGQDLFAFGNKAAPRAPRPVQDFGVSSPGDTVGPYSPSSPADVAHGASTFTDPKLAGLTGQYHLLPAGTQLPDGLGAFADGADVGGPMPAGHWTIYPTAPMTVSEFGDLFLSLPWQWAGKI